MIEQFLRSNVNPEILCLYAWRFQVVVCVHTGVRAHMRDPYEKED
jgi:hypothetical protein